MTKILLNAPLVYVGKNRVNLEGMTDPQAPKKGWRVYSNKCWGKIAYAFGFAIKAEFKSKDGKTKVWYINKNSFAKRSVNLSFFNHDEVKSLVAKIRKKNGLPEIANQPIRQEPSPEFKQVIDGLKMSLMVSVEDTTKDQTVKSEIENSFQQVCDKALAQNIRTKEEFLAIVDERMKEHANLKVFSKGSGEGDIFQSLDQRAHPQNVIVAFIHPHEHPEVPLQMPQVVENLNMNLIVNLDDSTNDQSLKDKALKAFDQICKDALAQTQSEEALVTFINEKMKADPNLQLFSKGSGEGDIFLSLFPSKKHKKNQPKPPNTEIDLGPFNILKEDPYWQRELSEGDFQAPKKEIQNKVSELLPKVKLGLDYIYERGKNNNFSTEIDGHTVEFSMMTLEQLDRWMTQKEKEFLEHCFDLSLHEVSKFLTRLQKDLKNNAFFKEFCAIPIDLFNPEKFVYNKE